MIVTLIAVGANCFSLLFCTFILKLSDAKSECAAIDVTFIQVLNICDSTWEKGPLG